jgi:hypothetical protein
MRNSENISFHKKNDGGYNMIKNISLYRREFKKLKGVLYYGEQF